MIVLSGADLVLPDRIVSPGTIVIDGGRRQSLPLCFTMNPVRRDPV